MQTSLIHTPKQPFAQYATARAYIEKQHWTNHPSSLTNFARSRDPSEAQVYRWIVGREEIAGPRTRRKTAHAEQLVQLVAAIARGITDLYRRYHAIVARNSSSSRRNRDSRSDGIYRSIALHN